MKQTSDIKRGTIFQSSDRYQVSEEQITIFVEDGFVDIGHNGGYKRCMLNHIETATKGDILSLVRARIIIRDK